MSLSTITDTPDHVIIGNSLIAELADPVDEVFIVDNLPTFLEFGDWLSGTPQSIASGYWMHGTITSFPLRATSAVCVTSSWR